MAELTTRNGKPLGVWEEITKAEYDDAFEALPPAHMWTTGFLLGERYSTTPDGLHAVYHAYAFVPTPPKGERYYRTLATLPMLPFFLRELRAKLNPPTCARCANANWVMVGHSCGRKS